MADLKYCPFCGGAHIEVINLIEEDPKLALTDMTKNNWAVLCRDCFAKGGIRRTATEAVEAWEMRKGVSFLDKTLHIQQPPDNVNHPGHYESGKFECIEVMEETQGTEAVLDFCICNAFKYLYRHRRKNGLEDVKKARWYLDKFIELEEREGVQQDDQGKTARV